ncbi:MAG: hypothetical protein M2R45_02876 [Verrucomicrobia subdivision 3 bacterium]|nr:hypothetical protein [Limisphaerales bacterium]MCS1414728.1 hypothetical protein [Limisphaerales bacterium]
MGEWLVEFQRGKYRRHKDTLFLTDSKYAKLAPYHGVDGVYKCPSDKSAVIGQW